MGKLQSKIGLVVLLQKFNFQYVNKSLEKQEIEYHPRQFFLTPKETIFVKVSSIAEHYKETIWVKHLWTSQKKSHDENQSENLLKKNIA